MKKIIATILCSFSFLIIAHLNAQTDTTFFSEIMNGQQVGVRKIWQSENGRYHEFYKINDRGRGDSLHIEYRENAKGFMTQLSIKGHDYFKAPVEETFSLDKGVAKWKNESEDEERLLPKDAFYLALKGTGGNLLKALLKNNHQVDLIPSGRITLEIVKEHIIEVNGHQETLSLYSTQGLGMTPSYGWMDEGGNDFASLSNWYSSILKGYESFREELFEIQKVEEERFFTELSQKHVEKPERILLQHVNLFDSKKAMLRPNMFVLIENGRITKVSKKNIQVSEDIQVINGEGQTLLPGLIDMHVHLSTNLAALQHVVCGVTSARDLGNSFAVLDFKERIADGSVIGPTLEVLAGLVDGKGPFAGPTPALGADASEITTWVDTFATKGYQQIKLYSSIKPEWVPAIIARAKSYGMRVSGHIPAFMTAKQAINAGYDEIQHMNMVFLNFWGDTVDTRSPMRFTLPAQKAASFDYEGQELKDFIKLLKKKKVTIDPTLGAFESMFIARPGEMSPAYVPVVDRLPITWQRSIRAGGGGLPIPEGYDQTYKDSFRGFQKMTKVLYDAGIPIVAGTDGWAGFSMHRELELYVDAGIPANEVLQIATLGAAKVLDKTDSIGIIAKGRRANLVLIDGNPVENIRDIRRVKLVIKDGAIYDTKGLLGEISMEDYE